MPASIFRSLSAGFWRILVLKSRHRWSPTMPALTRRDFLKASAAVGTLPGLTAAGTADSPNERHVLAVMGVRNRGRDLLRGFSAFDDAEIACICEVDANMVPAAMKSINPRQKR